MEIVSMSKKLKGNNTKNPNSATTVVEDIVWEVLVRLPTKSLMRFKIVSQLWNSFICNPNFAKEHTLRGGAFRGLLIVDNVSFDDPHPGPRHFLYADIHRNNNMSIHRWLDHQLKVGSVANDIVTTNVVKGLIGLYDRRLDGFTLCNIATHELLNLPPSTTTPSEPKHTHIYNCHLGFDPIQDVYKILKTCRVYDDHGCFGTILNCEIINLGGEGGGWRVIDPPPVQIHTRSLWIDRVLYWLPPKRINKPFELIMFHLETETFQTIPISIPDYDISSWHDLVRIDNSPALINRCLSSGAVEHTVDMWMVEDTYRGIELSEATWIKHVIHLPGRRWGNGDDGDYYSYAGILPTGEVILAQMLDVCEYWYPVPFNVYCYDQIKKKLLLLITIDDVNPSSASQYDLAIFFCIDVCYFEENIIALSSLATNHKR